MNVILCGAAGRMGCEMCALIKNRDDMNIVAAVDIIPCEEEHFYKSIVDVKGRADVILDFSHHSAIRQIAKYATDRKIPLVVATTGHTEEEIEIIHRAAEEIPVFFASNMSLGLLLICEFSQRLAKVFPCADVEIIETHHFYKADVPSGSALTIAKAIKTARGGGEIVVGRRAQDAREKGQICINSLRLGSVFGTHEVIFDDGNGSVSIKHVAHSRELYACGAERALRFIVLQKAGLYCVKDMV